MRIFSFILCFFIFNFCKAQSSDSNYSVKWVDADEGLNQLSVKNCMLDDSGFLWISTEFGVFRYDGNEVVPLENSKYPTISKQRIYYMAKDEITGSIYFVTETDLKTYTIKKGIVEQIKNEKKLGLFLKNSTFLNTTNSTYKMLNEFLEKETNDFYNKFLKYYNYSLVKNKNYYYYIYNKKISCVDLKGNLTTIKFPTNEHSNLLRFDESIVVLGDCVASTIEKNKLNKKIKIDNIIREYIKNSYNIKYYNFFESNGSYFIDLNGKFYKVLYSNNNLYTQFLFNSPEMDIQSVYYEPNKDLYFIGTKTKGLAIVSLNNINVFATGNDILDWNYTVVEQKNNLFSYNGWQYNIKTNKSKVKFITNTFGNFRFLLPYANKIYYESTKNRLYALEDFPKENILNLHHLPNYLVSYTYLNKKLWLCSDNFLGYKIENSFIAEQSINKIIKPNRLINTIYGFSNNLILGTTKGVYKFNPITKSIQSISKLENVNARYIKQIDSSSFWVGCYGNGLFLVKNNKAFKVIDKNIDLNTAHAIEVDKFGNLWMSTNNGLLTINKKTIINNTLRNLPVEFYRFSTKDGLLTNEFNGGSTHPSLKTKDGIIGFPSMKGFVWFNPENLKKQLFKGRITIDNIISDNKKASSLVNGVYNIDKESKILKINFSYGYYFNRDNLTIEYRFEDQKKWTEISENSFQIGRYKKGLQKLQIRIRTHSFNSSFGVTKVVELNFEPKYFETYWFWGLCAFIFALFIFTSYKIGLAINKSRKKQLEEKIEAKTQELLLTISELDQSQKKIHASLIEKDILLKEIHHRVKNNLQLVMSILNIQASDKENTSIEGFIEKGQSRIASMVLIHENLYQKEDIGNIDFETYTESLVKNIRTTFGEISERIDVYIKMENVFFDIQTSIPLGLILNELVTNSFKHGFPNEKSGLITISIEQINNTNYKLAIEDTGIGFPKDKEDKKSIGLELVSLLVLQLKGELNIDSKNGTAFEIIFTIT